ncbi:MAG: gliding motility-associated ABC transporter substrate-binding protein GldG [Paludibacteraceae bacterium]|nr:gliding motility-associated ABC transporter substrate-binding protein GldG [Paludibacteraceae bacterium]
MLANLLAQLWVVRLDLTQDKRHTLSAETKQLCHNLNGDVEVAVYLQANVNSGFLRLASATRQLMQEMSVYGNIHYSFVNPNDLTDREKRALDESLLRHNLHPTAIYESADNQSRKETIVYPFALLKYGDRQQWVSLLRNRRDLSGTENLNQSIETLEYTFSLALNSLMQFERRKVVFLEGQGELGEQNTQDVQTALAEYFDVYRGTLTEDADCLSPFSAVIIADPQQSFSEADKYIIDQYIMSGGRVLWLLNGVRFSEQVLQDEGFTPALSLDLNLTDLLFRYGVRINSRLLQDLQCISVPVDVSRNPDQPQWQPMPWTYAPLLLTSSQSAVTCNLSPVLATFCSDLTTVGDDDNTEKTVLLATSANSRALPVPGEVNLGELRQDPALFNLSYLPVAVSLEGEFTSLFTHRMTPEGINLSSGKRTVSPRTKQIVVAAGSVIENDLQNGQPLPAGYDRYSHIQFANRDFILNSLLWLTDYSNLLALRKKEIPLRILNKKSLQNGIALPATLSIALPLLLLAITGVAVQLTRKRKYTR